MRIEALTGLGLVRKENEDSIFVDKENGYYIVADGMGGHKQGKTASLLAVEEAVSFLQKHSNLTIHERLEGSIQAANTAVYQENCKQEDFIVDPEKFGMGTTILIAILEGNKLHIAHVGDTRAYALRKGKLEQLTKDHSFVNKLLDEGLITEDEALIHPEKNVLTRALGFHLEIKADTLTDTVEKGSCFILCSDGVYNLISKKNLVSILQQNEDLVSKLKGIEKQILLNGAKDNYSLIILCTNEEVANG
ncbi:MAG: protein phosphatase 2C domain-containing protein [Clostridia bacterium]